MEKLDLVPIGSARISASDLEAFDCGNPMIDQYLVQQANVFDEENRAKTFLLLSHQGIVGYYTLIVGCLEVEDIQNQVLLKKPYVNLGLWQTTNGWSFSERSSYRFLRRGRAPLYWVHRWECSLLWASWLSVVASFAKARKFHCRYLNHWVPDEHNLEDFT